MVEYDNLCKILVEKYPREEQLGEEFLDFSNVSDLVTWLEKNTSI